MSKVNGLYETNISGGHHLVGIYCGDVGYSLRGVCRNNLANLLWGTVMKCVKKTQTCRNMLTNSMFRGRVNPKKNTLVDS